jgi:hypothetical protein
VLGDEYMSWCCQQTSFGFKQITQASDVAATLALHAAFARLVRANVARNGRYAITSQRESMEQ